MYVCIRSISAFLSVYLMSLCVGLCTLYFCSLQISLYGSYNVHITDQCQSQHSSPIQCQVINIVIKQCMQVTEFKRVPKHDPGLVSHVRNALMLLLLQWQR